MKEKKGESTMYRLMRMSETSDENGFSEEDAEEIFREKNRKNFKEEYKEFYTDIKISIKEDW